MPTTSGSAAFRSPRPRTSRITASPVLVVAPAIVTRYSIRGEAAPRSLGREMAQDVLQDAAVLVVVQFVDGIDAAEQPNPLEPAIGGDDLGKQPLMRLEIAVQAADRALLVAL